MTVRHLRQEDTNWREDHRYFTPIPFGVERNKVAITSAIDDAWVKGIYVVFRSLTDVEFVNGDRWMQARR